ncbi:PHP domain-containing protein [Candidatus Woesearchaeota archaeon]|nr:PHP domain-containing protein [Candidatus Woesearchaeota archaeon]
MLKSDFHIHTNCRTDNLGYSARDLIKAASKLGYDVLSITNHNCRTYDNVKSYAKKKGILLIPGAEVNVGRKHVIILNTKHDSNLSNPEQLEKMKKEGAFLIAPHPFFPHPSSMRMDFFLQHKHLFDALEYSFFYTKHINYNKKVIAMGKKYNIPVVACSDLHGLNNLDRIFTFVDADKNIDSVLEAIRKNKIKIHTEPLTPVNFVRIGFKVFLSEYFGMKLKPA